MIISEAIRYAQRNGIGQPGFRPATAKYVLECDTEPGDQPVEEDFSVNTLGNPDEKKNQKNQGLLFESCPETPAMNSGGKSHILLETIEVVLGVNDLMFKTTKDEDAKKIAKILDKHRFFTQSLRLMAPFFPEAALFSDFLENEDFCQKMYQSLVKEKKAKASDKITLRAISSVTGSPVYLVNEERWRPWWTEYRKTLMTGGDKSKTDSDEGNLVSENGETDLQKSKKKKSSMLEETANTMISLVTGELVEFAETHPKITELTDVGAISSGASFICFDKASLKSYGLDKSANAAMNERSASEYRAALDDIFKNRSKRFGNIKIGYWYKHPVQPEDDPISMLAGIEKDEDNQDIRDSLNNARQLLDAWNSGEKKQPLENQYFSLIVSGITGRVMIRDWSVGNFTDWVRAADQWFADTTIIHRDGSGEICQHKFFAFLGSILRDLKDLKTIPTIVVTLWKAALNPNIGIPESAVSLALRRIRIEMYGDKDGKIPSPNHARMGLLRAYLVRNKGDNNMKPFLNEDHPDVAYQCGRLMSLLADLQYSALGNINAGLAQRFYSAASVTPRLVFGRLMRMAQFYLGKSDAGYIIEGRIADVWGRIENEIPASFSLQQQTLFAQGYYQEQARRRKEIADLKASKKANQS